MFATLEWDALFNPSLRVEVDYESTTEDAVAAASAETDSLSPCKYF